MKETVETLQRNGGNMSEIKIKKEFEEILLPHVDCQSVEFHVENDTESAGNEVVTESVNRPNSKEDVHASEYIKKLLEDWREEEDEEGDVQSAKKTNVVCQESKTSTKSFKQEILEDWEKKKEEDIKHKVTKKLNGTGKSSISNVGSSESKTSAKSLTQEILEDWEKKKEEDIKQEIIDEHDSFSCSGTVQVSSTVPNVEQPTSVSSTEVPVNLNKISVKNDRNFRNNQDNYLSGATMHSSMITKNIDSLMKEPLSSEAQVSRRAWRHTENDLVTSLSGAATSANLAGSTRISDDSVEEDSNLITTAENTCMCYQSVSGSKKRKINLYDMLVKIDKRLDKSEDEFDMIGKRIASRLRKLPQETALVAEKLMNDIMFECEKGNVNIHTRLNVHQISQQNMSGPSCSYSSLNKKISTWQETECMLFSSPD